MSSSYFASTGSAKQPQSRNASRSWTSTSGTSSPRRLPQTPSSASRTTPFPRSHTAASSATSTFTRSTTRSTATTGRGGVICAISEARGVAPSVGIVFVNIATGEAILSQICDTQFYIKTMHKISVMDPARILMVSTAAGGGAKNAKSSAQPKSSLSAAIEDTRPDIPVTFLDRKYWSETAGLEYLQTLVFNEELDAVLVAVEGNFYATCAFAAAVKYLEVELGIRFCPHTLRVSFKPSEESMMIDLHTIQSLELLQNVRNKTSKDCLFGLLNQTCTAMGTRLLRSNILQPSTQVEAVLTPRFDALEELSTSEDMFFGVRKALKEFDDVEKLLTKLIIIPAREGCPYETEEALNSVLKVKKFLLSVEALVEALAPARSQLLGKARHLCRQELIAPILAPIVETVNENATFSNTALQMRNQRIYCVKAGIHGMLDVARKTYQEATEDIHEYVKELNTHYNLAAEVKYENSRQYYLKFQATDFDGPVPDVFVNVVRKKDTIECQTLEMVKSNQRIANAEIEAIMLSDKVVQGLIDTIRGHASQMFRICESIGIVDMLASFCHLVTTRDYCRPVMTGTLALKAARHPILDEPAKFVPNDYYGSSGYRFQILTGCNMSGKSTYIRCVALLQIMAQIGCFVPAQYAAFPVIQDMFSRLSTDDSIESNLSTFSVEMREMAFILRNINSKSMAIIDELGRGTSTRDGLSIAIAMSEALIQSNAIVFFATHFGTLAKVLNDRPGVVNMHLSTEKDEGDGVPKRVMLYKVASGIEQEEHYGIELARAMGLPANMVDYAQQVSDALRARGEANRRSAKEAKAVKRRKLLLNLRELILNANASDMGEYELAEYLRALQKEFTLRMAQLQEDADEEEEEELEMERAPSEQGEAAGVFGGDEGGRGHDDAQHVAVSTVHEQTRSPGKGSDDEELYAELMDEMEHGVRRQESWTPPMRMNQHSQVTEVGMKMARAGRSGGK